MLSDYCLVKFRDRNVIAFSFTKNHGVIRAAVKRYQPDTPKRALFRYWLEIVTLFRLSGVWERVSRDELTRVLGFNLDQWIEEVSETLREPDLLPVLIWPPEPSRKRIYVHLLNADGNALGFAKIAFDSKSNRQLQRECETLQVLNESNHRKFYVPSVIAHNLFGNNYYLIVEVVPETAKTYRASNIGFPLGAVKEYSGTVRDFSYGQIKESNWYKKFCRLLDGSSCFMAGLSAISDKERVKLCRIHGDLGPSNLLQVDGRLWIIDWEESCDKGPYLTDFVCFHLALNRKRVMTKPHRVLDQMISEFSYGPHCAKLIDIMMALTFLHGANFTLATMLLAIWPKKGSIVFDFAN